MNFKFLHSIHYVINLKETEKFSLFRLYLLEQIDYQSTYKSYSKWQYVLRRINQLSLPNVKLNMSYKMPIVDNSKVKLQLCENYLFKMFQSSLNGNIFLLQRAIHRLTAKTYIEYSLEYSIKLQREYNYIC